MKNENYSNNLNLSKEIFLGQMITIIMIANCVIYVFVGETIFKFGILDVKSVSIDSSVLYLITFIGIVSPLFIPIIRDKILVNLESMQKQAAIIRLKIADIVSAAIGEIPSIVGLILFFVSGGNRFFLYLLAFYSLFFLIIFFPKISDWASLLKINLQNFDRI